MEKETIKLSELTLTELLLLLEYFQDRHHTTWAKINNELLSRFKLIDFNS